MKIRDLSIWEAFYRVALDSSFVTAAKNLKIGPPMLTKRIQELEEELGVRLFQRTTRKVSLTQEGLAILPRVKSFLEDAESMEREFEKSREISGTIRLTCVTAFAHRVLAPLILKFCKTHPKIKFEIDPTDRYVDLIDSQLDLAIRVDTPKGADFVFKKLIENKLVLCASPSFLKSQKVQIQHPRDLKRYPLLMLPVYKNCKFIESGVALSDFKKEIQIESESGLFLTELALQGAGIAVRSHWDVKHFINKGQLVQVLERHTIESFGTIYAVITSKRLLSPRVRAFLDFLDVEFQKIRIQ
ncbi:MAG: LysR family transcriptional regulator [Bdellovibrio sp.]